MRIRKFLNSLGVNAANPPSPLPPSVIALFNSLKKRGSREAYQELTVLRETKINVGQFPSNPPLIISKEINLDFLFKVLQGMMEFSGIKKKKKRSQTTGPNNMFLTKSSSGGGTSSC